MAELRKSTWRQLSEPFHALHNTVFAKLYLAETISLLGDAFTWVGLALLSYQFGEDRSAIVLSTALTLRVAAFIIFSPFAGAVADKLGRKKVLYSTHFIRMGIVGCLPFVKAEWQVYGLVLLLNIFNAFFTPTYRAVIPHVIEKEYYRQSVGLSNATFQLLGVLGPGMAGVLAIWLGAREIFYVDAASFIIAGVLILQLPATALQPINMKGEAVEKTSAWKGVIDGIRLLFSNKLIRFALSIEFVSAIAGAQILVNTIGHVKSGLHLDYRYYGWLMAAFGIGAAVAAFAAGSLDKSKSRQLSLISGALLIGLAISFANYVPYPALLVFWLCAGLGQTLAEMPSETLIGENIGEAQQGTVYGAHFAFSHLWWAVAYPVAGVLGTHFVHNNFLYGGVLTIGFLLLACVLFRPKQR